jgi:hypothetical protein
VFHLFEFSWLPVLVLRPSPEIGKNLSKYNAIEPAGFFMYRRAKAIL